MLAYGIRESSESRADLLRDAKRRGMRAPVLAVGDGALGSGKRFATCSRNRSAAVPSGTKRQRSQCLAEVRAPGREEALAEIHNAEVEPGPRRCPLGVRTNDDLR
jgi:hypothetical protein